MSLHSRWSLIVTMLLGCISQQAFAEPRQRVVISDNYTSWLLKSEDSERYGEGEALPRLLDEGWTIATVTPSCSQDGHTVYVLDAPALHRTPEAGKR